MPAQEVPRVPRRTLRIRSSHAAGAPRALRPCWMRTSRIRQAPAASRARSCFRPRALSPARVRGPCLPLHSSPRGRAASSAPTSLVHLKPGHLRDFIVCSCPSSYLACPGECVAHSPPAVPNSLRSAHSRNRFGQRTGIEDPGETQGPPEGAFAFRQREASRIRMQVRSPTRPFAGRIGHSRELVRAGLDRDKPQQLGGRRTLPATNTGANRRSRVRGQASRGRATYRQEVYPALSARAAPGPVT